MARVNSPTWPNTVKATERAWKAVKLRAEAKTFDEIAAELGYGSRAGAYRAVTRQLERMAQDTPDAAAARVLESEHLQHLREKVMPAVETGDLGAIDRAVKISERYSKLNGLDLNESRVAGALEAGAVANLMATSNLQAGIIAAMGKIGMPLEQQDALIAAINEWLAEQAQPEPDEDETEPVPSELVIITGEVEEPDERIEF